MVFPKPKYLVLILLGVVSSQLLFGGVSDPTSALVSAAPAPTPPEKGAFTAYKGVSLGMKTADARKLLGDPKDKSDAQDFYIISENETIQVYYEGSVVSAISIDFAGDIKNAPSCKAVLGEDVAAKPDGGVYKLLRFPKAGYWVSYNKTGGANPLVSITIQKM
jgi:hypothetical protein